SGGADVVELLFAETRAPAAVDRAVGAIIRTLAVGNHVHAVADVQGASAVRAGALLVRVTDGVGVRLHGFSLSLGLHTGQRRGPCFWSLSLRSKLRSASGQTRATWKVIPAAATTAVSRAPWPISWW